jgi:hypothetical protein
MLVPVAEAPVVLPEMLAGDLEGLTTRLAQHMGEGLMAASVAIGLDVLDQMMRIGAMSGTAPRRGR